MAKSQHEIIRRLHRGRGYKHANTLFDQMWQNCISYCEAFFEKTGNTEIPFLYSERSSTSVILAGLSAANACVIPEVSARRKARGNPTENNARIDMWAQSDQGAEFYIEIKHYLFAIGNGSKKVGFEKRWSALEKQIKGMRGPLKRDYAHQPFWLCGMMIVPLYRDANDAEKAKKISARSSERLINSSPFKNADWIAKWSLSPKMACTPYPDSKGNNRYYFVPEILIFMKAQYIA